MDFERLTYVTRFDALGAAATVFVSGSVKLLSHSADDKTTPLKGGVCRVAICRVMSGVILKDCRLMSPCRRVSSNRLSQLIILWQQGRAARG